MLPYVETHRIAPGVDDWGSGIGDLALNARYDFKLAAEMLYWPGFALLANVVLPTGKAVGDGTNPASTDATGTGTSSVSLGVDLEKVHGPLYGALYALGDLQRRAAPSFRPGATASLTTSYPLQATALAVAGYVFENEAAAALYVNFLERGDNTLNGVHGPARDGPAPHHRGRHRPPADRRGLAALSVGLQRRAPLVVRAQPAGGRRVDASLVRAWR